MISCRKGARSNVRDEIDMRSLECAIGSCLKGTRVMEKKRYRAEKVQGCDGKEAISSRKGARLQDRDFGSINCEQRASPSSFVVTYVVSSCAEGERRCGVVVASSSRRRPRRCHAVSGGVSPQWAS